MLVDGLFDRVDDRCWSQLINQSPRFLQAPGGVQGHFPQPAVLVQNQHATFRFFILLISILNWHELDPLSMRVLITCSLVECSDICNLLKDGEDDQ